MTTSSAAAVNTSRPPYCAMNLSAGRSRRRLPTMTTAIAPKPLAASTHPLSVACPSCARSGSSCDERYHREVLEQQDRERLAPGRRGKLLALAEPREHDRGRRHREAEADDDRGLPCDAEAVSDHGEHDAARRNLRAAEPEHRAAQRPQP